VIFLSVVIGLFLVPAYELLYFVRRAVKRSRLLCKAEDFLLAIAFAIASYYFMFFTCGGVVRGYNYIFAGCGEMISFSICSRLKEYLKLKKAIGTKTYENILEELSNLDEEKIEA
jgi:hypothetical protein